MSIVAHRDMELRQMDVCTAFLYAPIKEEVYMEQPEGCEKSWKNMVCKLNKTLYGTKQASHEWNAVINAFLLSIGFTRCVSDTCMYVRKTRTGGIMIIGLFVDDLPIAFDKQDEEEWNEVKAQFTNRFKMKDMGECQLILGMRVTRDRKNKILKIDNEVHIKRTLDTHGMSTCGTKPTPATEEKLVPRPANEQNTINIQQYQSIVGSLNYLAQACRPDICYAVNQLCRYASNPSLAHLTAAKHVLRYLKGTSDIGLVYSGGDKDTDLETSTLRCGRTQTGEEM